MVKLGNFELDSLRFYKTVVGLSKKAIERFAKSQGILIPCEYLDFLQIQNGSYPDRAYFELKGEWFWLSNFFCLDNDGFNGSEESDSFSLAYQNAKMGQFVPHGFTIIGEVVRDDFLVIENKTGRIGVVLWDEVRELGHKPSAKFVKKLAPSFVGFLQLLKDSDAATF